MLVIGCLYALPNLYPTQPSIQVAYTDSGKSADQLLLDELQTIFDDTNSKYEEIFLRENKIVIKFSSLEEQLNSKTIIQVIAKAYIMIYTSTMLICISSLNWFNEDKN